MTAFTLPPDDSRIKTVKSFHELVTTAFAGGVNALCWQRTLPCHCSKVVKPLGGREGITTLDDARLLALPVSATGRAGMERRLPTSEMARGLSGRLMASFRASPVSSRTGAGPGAPFYLAWLLGLRMLPAFSNCSLRHER